MTETLGPALVAGALGRKVGDARTATMMRGITECRVELLSTRQKAKLPVRAVPNNSAESNSVIDGIGAYDARLSLSATDQQVHLDLLGDVTGITTTAATPDKGEREILAEEVNPEPRRISLTSVTKRRDETRPRSELTNEKDNVPQTINFFKDVDDTPVTPGEIATPTTYLEIADRSAERVMPRKETQVAGRIECEDDVSRATGKRQVLREIDMATALRVHLAETNPELITATSFFNAVCDRTHERKRRKINEVAAPGANEMEKMGASPRTTDLSENAPSSKMIPASGGLTTGSKRRGGGDVESDSDHEITDVVVLDDTEKSERETSCNESGSRSSSGSSSFSSDHSRASRKRAADGSPERKPRRIERRIFPGVTSQGKGGCRLFMPTREKDEHAAIDEAIASDEVSSKTMGVASRTPPREEDGARSVGNRDKPTGETASEDMAVTEATVHETNVACVIDGSRRNLSMEEKGTTHKELYTTTGPSSTIERGTPFVVINTVVKIPAQLFAKTHVRADETKGQHAIVTEGTLEVPTTRSTTDTITASAVTTTNEWGRHGFVVAEVYKVLATMEPPWGSLCVYEAMAWRFPEVDPTALQMTVLAVLMTQRQCVRDLTLAEARRGPRRDENGEVFIELDLVYANRYSDSY